MNKAFRIVIATNAFKNSISSSEAADAIWKGLEESNLLAECILLPVADGGDHTLEVLMNYFNGSYSPYIQVQDPLERKIKARYGIVVIKRHSTAIVELAEASGIRNLEEAEKNVMMANTYGTGQLIEEAIQNGVRKVLLGVGGSAGVDAGTGLLQALGFTFIKKNGRIMVAGGKELSQLADIKFPKQPLPSDFSIDVLCDVTNPLIGPGGAAAIFGPQKGATPEEVKILENGLKNFADVVYRVTGKQISATKYGGAAGGTAAGLYALLGARLLPGAEKVLELCNFASATSGARLIITTEGRLDSQSLQGKATTVVAEQAGKAGVPVIALVGQTDAELKHDVFSAILPIGNSHPDIATALRYTREDLHRTATQLGNLIATLHDREL